jgi:hypothetical protein
MQMKRLAILAALTLTVALTLATPVGATPAHAATVRHIDGGGTATISQFGLGVMVRPDGSASGHFLCLMAGRTAGVVPGNGHSMVVSGQVTAAVLKSETSATLWGTARVLLDGQTLGTGVAFSVEVSAGGPGQGTLQLNLSGMGILLPVEDILSGQISMH